MTVQGITNLVRFHWVTLILACLVGANVGFGVAAASQKQYTAEAQVFVSVNSGRSASDIAQGADYAQQQARNFAAVTTRELVLQPVIEELDLGVGVDDLRRTVSTTVPLNTSIIAISATDGSAERSAQIANAVARSLSGSIDLLVPEASSNQTAVRVQVVEEAGVPSTPSSPRVLLSAIVGAIAALCLATAMVALWEVFRAKVRTADQAGQLTGSPVLGVVTRFRGEPSDHLPPAALSPQAEQYRQIRTNFRFLQMDQQQKAFVIASAVPGEGKSTTAFNVAAATAASGVRVCLVEADLRRPSLASVLDLDAVPGFTSVLAGDLELDEVLQPWGEDGLRVMVAGPLPPNPSELLGSTRAESVLQALRGQFDVIIVDSPPLVPVSDAAVLARIFGGVVLVVAERQVEVRDIRRAVERVRLVGAPVLGTIVTKSRNGPFEGGYHYGSSDDDAPASGAKIDTEIISHGYVAKRPADVERSDRPAVHGSRPKD